MTTGFVDLQVNGGFGLDFNGELWSEESLDEFCRKMRAIGVAQFLPTLITDDLTVMSERLACLCRTRATSDLAKSMIPGFHLEGPFLSKEAGYVGAHPAAHIVPATIERMQRLLEAGEGLVRLVTLAPEQDANGMVTRYLTKQQVRVSAGHTDASLDQLKASIQYGVSAFTHLGNATPSMMARHDNIIQRVLYLRGQLRIMLIADGHHLPPFVLRNLLDWIGVENAIVVSDAIGAAGMPPGEYHLCGQDVRVGGDGSCRSLVGSNFVGSASTLERMHQVLRDQLHLPDTSIDRLLRLNAMAYMDGFGL